jgi:hypothetical protein
LEEIAAAICAGVSEQHGFQLQVVALLPLGAVLKTSSGKVRRQDCRAAFLKGALPELSRWTQPAPEPITYASAAHDVSLATGS